jgi:hypothetical protein
LAVQVAQVAVSLARNPPFFPRLEHLVAVERYTQPKVRLEFLVLVTPAAAPRQAEQTVTGSPPVVVVES